MRQKTVSSRLEVKKRLDSSTVDDAMGRFEQFERKIGDLESQVEAYDVGTRSLKDEIASLEADSRIDDELVALKQRMSANKAKASGVSDVSQANKA
jgi:phage shock protein A